MYLYYTPTDVNVPGRFYCSLKERKMDSRLSQNTTVVVFLTRLVPEAILSLETRAKETSIR